MTRLWNQGMWSRTWAPKKVMSQYKCEVVTDLFIPHSLNIIFFVTDVFTSAEVSNIPSPELICVRNKCDRWDLEKLEVKFESRMASWYVTTHLTENIQNWRLFQKTSNISYFATHSSYQIKNSLIIAPFFKIFQNTKYLQWFAAINFIFIQISLFFVKSNCKILEDIQVFIFICW